MGRIRRVSGFFSIRPACGGFCKTGPVARSKLIYPPGIRVLRGRLCGVGLVSNCRPFFFVIFFIQLGWAQWYMSFFFLFSSLDNVHIQERTTIISDPFYCRITFSIHIYIMGFLPFFLTRYNQNVNKPNKENRKTCYIIRVNKPNKKNKKTCYIIRVNKPNKEITKTSLKTTFPTVLHRRDSSALRASLLILCSVPI